MTKKLKKLEGTDRKTVNAKKRVRVATVEKESWEERARRLNPRQWKQRDEALAHANAIDPSIAGMDSDYRYLMEAAQRVAGGHGRKEVIQSDWDEAVKKTRSRHGNRSALTDDDGPNEGDIMYNAMLVGNITHANVAKGEGPVKSARVNLHKHEPKDTSGEHVEGVADPRPGGSSTYAEYGHIVSGTTERLFKIKVISLKTKKGNQRRITEEKRQYIIAWNEWVEAGGTEPMADWWTEFERVPRDQEAFARMQLVKAVFRDIAEYDDNVKWLEPRISGRGV